MRVERELMRGAGPLAVLKLLEHRDMYGYELVEALSRRSDGVLAMPQSTLYPMLYNLESKNLIRPIVLESQEGRRRKYYRLTPQGRDWLVSHEGQWSRLVRAMSKFGLRQEPGEAGTGGDR